MTLANGRALLRLAQPGPREARRLWLSVALATGAALAAIALLATSGYLISRAAERPPILMLMVAIVAVRAFGLSRAVLRYGERLASHDLALRQLGRLRRRFYRSLVPLVPGALSNRSGDLLSRFVVDVDTLRDLYLRVVIPGLVAVLVLIAATLAAWLMLPSAGVTVLLSLSLAVVALPWLSGTVASRAARRQAPARSHLTSELVEAIDGASELALAGAGAVHAERLARSDKRLARIARSDALSSSAAARCRLAARGRRGAGAAARRDPRRALRRAQRRAARGARIPDARRIRQHPAALRRSPQPARMRDRCRAPAGACAAGAGGQRPSLRATAPRRR